MPTLLCESAQAESFMLCCQSSFCLPQCHRCLSLTSLYNQLDCVKVCPSKLCALNSVLFDLAPDTASRPYVDHSMAVPGLGSYMHLFLGIDATSLPADLGAHHIVINSWDPQARASAQDISVHSMRHLQPCDGRGALLACVTDQIP